jgi:CheY-like chemotaxis protein
MNVNQLALQLESLLSAAYPQAVTMDLSTDLEPAGVQSASADEFLQVLVEEICAYREIDAILIWTEAADSKEPKSSGVSLGIEVYSAQITVPEPKTENLWEFAARLRNAGSVLRLRAAAGRWIRYETFFPPAIESDRGVYSAARGETILLVEDEDIIRSVTTQVLESCGYRVLAAKDAKTAADIFRLNLGRIEVLLTDLRLAGENGAELAERLTGSNPQLKVILMSGYAEREVIGREFGDVSMAYLSKPFSVESLVGKVRQVLESWPAEEIVGHQFDSPLGAGLHE